MNIKDFLTYLSARGCSENTVKAYRGDLEQYEAFLKSKHIRCTAATPKLLQEFINQMNETSLGTGIKPAPSTVWRKMASISTYYEWLRLQSNGKTNNPAKAVPRPRLRRGEPKAIPDHQLQPLLGGISNIRDRALVSLFVSTGLRLSELFQLNRKTIKVEKKTLPDGETRILGVGTVIGKGNKERMFLVDADTLGVVSRYLRSRKDDIPALFISNRKLRLSRREIQHIFENWCRRLRLPRYHIHQCRHAFAERAANAGISSLVLKELMGHESFDTTRGYFRIKRQRLAAEYYAAMELINPSTPDTSGSES